MNVNTSGFVTSFQKGASKSSQKKIDNILSEINRLGDVDKFLLYLQLPTAVPTDHSREASAGNKAEVKNAQLWIRTHLQQDPELCLPKQEVFDEYREYCTIQDVRPVGREDFGKLMKTAFPNVRSRRLGTRGQTKHCYGGLTQRSDFTSPSLPVIRFDETHDLDDLNTGSSSDEITEKRELAKASCALICEWAEKLLQIPFTSIHDIAEHLIEQSYVRRNSEAAYTIMSQIQRFREANNLTAPQHAATDAHTGSGTPGPSGRSAKHQLQLKLQEKGRLKEQQRKLEQQRSVIAGSSLADDSSSQDTIPVSHDTASHMTNEASVSSAESASFQGQSSRDCSGKGRPFPSVANQKPILPKPVAPVMSNTSACVRITSPACTGEPVNGAGSKLVLVSPSPQPLVLISSAPTNHTVLVPVQAQSGNGNLDNNLHGNSADVDIKPDVKKLEAARVVSKAISQAMANSPGNQPNQSDSPFSHSNQITNGKPPSEEQMSLENSQSFSVATSNVPVTASGPPVHGANTSHTSGNGTAESFHRSQSAPGHDTGVLIIKNDLGEDTKNILQQHKSEPVSNENSCQATNETGASVALEANLANLNSVLGKALVLNLPAGEGANTVHVAQGDLGKAIGAVNVPIDQVFEPTTAVPASAPALPSGQELLTTLGTQVLAALAAQQLASPLTSQLTPTKKTKTVSSLLREQRVKSTSPETVATRSHYVNDNRPVAQILKELREKKRLQGCGQEVTGGATQKLSFDSSQISDESILTLKQRIAREASVMKKAQLQSTKIKKESLSRDASPSGSPAPLMRPGIRSRASTLSRDPSRETSPVGSPASRASLKRAATVSRDTSPIGSPLGRHRGRAFSSAKVEENTRRIDAKRSKQAAQRSVAMARKSSATSAASEQANYPLNINCDIPVAKSDSQMMTQDPYRTNDSLLSYHLDEISPGGSSAILSAHSTAYHSNASNDSLESSFAHDRSRHSSGDMSFRSRHSSGDPNFRPLAENSGLRLGSSADVAPRSIGESICASNNPTLASLLSPDRGPHMETRNLRLAALLREQDVTESPPKPMKGSQFKDSSLAQMLHQGTDNQIGGTWNSNESFSTQSTLQQCLTLQDNSIQSGNFPQNEGVLRGLINQQGGINTSQFMPIQSVTEANIVSPVRPQAMVPSDRTNMAADQTQIQTRDLSSRESQVAQRLRVLLSSDNETDFRINPADNSQWLSNNQTSSFVPYNQACSNNPIDMNTGPLSDPLNMNTGPSMQQQQSFLQTSQMDAISETKPYSIDAKQVGNTSSFNDGFASMEGVRPPLKRNLDSDQNFLAKRQRHHSDQTNRRSKRVNFLQPMQPLLVPDKPLASPMGPHSASSSHESLPLLSPQIPNESPFSPEVQAIMSNDDWDTKEGYRSHSVPAHSFMQPTYDASLDSIFSQQVGEQQPMGGNQQQPFDNQEFMLLPQQPQLQNQSNAMQQSQNSMQQNLLPQNQPQPMLSQNHQLEFQQMQQQQNQQQHQNQLQSNNPQQNMQLGNLQPSSSLQQNHLQTSHQQAPANMVSIQSGSGLGADNSRKTHLLAQLLAQRLGSSKNASGAASRGVRGDHMISGASVAPSHMRERIKDTLHRILQNQQFQQQHQQLQQQRGALSGGQYAMHNPTPPQSHPSTPVDFSGGNLNADMANQAQGMMGNGGMMGLQQGMAGNMGMAGGLEGLNSSQQDPLFALCAADDNDNLAMLNQNSHLDVFL